MSVFRGDDKEIDFEEEDTRNQFPDLQEPEEEFCYTCGEPIEDGLCSGCGEYPDECCCDEEDDDYEEDEEGIE